MFDFQVDKLTPIFVKTFNAAANVAEIPDERLVRHPGVDGAKGIDLVGTARATNHDWIMEISSFSNVTSVQGKILHDLLPRIEIRAELHRLSDGKRIWRASGTGRASQIQGQRLEGCTPVESYVAEGGAFLERHFEGCAQAAVDSLVSQFQRDLSRKKISWD
jgi:hypothetical protein